MLIIVSLAHFRLKDRFKNEPTFLDVVINTLTFLII